jgi:small subunit ribosomal protein S6
LAGKLYECMFLLDSGRYAVEPDNTIGEVAAILERCGADIKAHAPWQDGKLAYAIEGHRKGLHYLAYFAMDGSKVPELDRLCKLNETIIRHLVIEHEARLFEALVENLKQHTTEPAPVAE